MSLRFLLLGVLVAPAGLATLPASTMATGIGCMSGTITGRPRGLSSQ